MLKKTIGVSGARTLTKAPKGVGGEKGTSEGTVGKKKEPNTCFVGLRSRVL